MRVSSFADFEPEFVERAHRIVWCDLASVGLDGRPSHRPSGVGVGPKANDVDRNPFVSLAYVSDPVKLAYECVATWVDNRDGRIAIWKRIAAIPEPLCYSTRTM
jgi:hypothetical protein